MTLFLDPEVWNTYKQARNAVSIAVYRGVNDVLQEGLSVEGQSHPSPPRFPKWTSLSMSHVVTWGPHWANRMTDTTEKITFPQLRWQAVNITWLSKWYLCTKCLYFLLVCQLTGNILFLKMALWNSLCVYFLKQGLMRRDVSVLPGSWEYHWLKFNKKVLRFLYVDAADRPTFGGGRETVSGEALHGVAAQSPERPVCTRGSSPQLHSTDLIQYVISQSV